MLVNENIDPQAEIELAKLEHQGFLVVPGRKIWHVDSVRVAAGTGGGDTKDHGNRWYDPFATIAFAVTQAGLHDVILVQPGHTESVIAADAWLWAKNGIQVIGLGRGTLRPTITIGTATSATILMDKADLVISGCRFIVAVDALVLMIAVSAAGCVIENCEFILDDSSTQALIGIDFSDAAADRCIVRNCHFEAITVGCDEAIEISAAVNHLTIDNCIAFGDFADACIHSTVIATHLRISRCTLTNTQTDHSIELTTTATGELVENYYANAMTQQTGQDTGSCKSFECYHCDAVDVSGKLSPVLT